MPFAKARLWHQLQRQKLLCKIAVKRRLGFSAKIGVASAQFNKEEATLQNPSPLFSRSRAVAAVFHRQIPSGGCCGFQAF
ncbi:MAG: hypothetical protein CM15mP46_3070 [Alphaproteobacteria bacterium]|nr:MAG: hypothetical protein CM15mP46_3070 [Alphaproteobacteria bacterium]